MSFQPGQQDLSANQHERISLEALERCLSIRGESDVLDFKEALGDLTNTSVRVNLAKDALAFCNLPDGGTLVIGVTDDYTRVGLEPNEHIDTTAIHNAINKYIDGDFIVLAAEHEMPDPGDTQTKRYGIIHFRRRTTQPVLAAKAGDIPNSSPLFRSGEIFIRRGAASTRANSGDVRRLLTNTIVHEQQIRAVNVVWACVLEQRNLISGVEYLYDILVVQEFQEVMSRSDFRSALGTIGLLEHAEKTNETQQRVSRLRPHLPEELFQQYRQYSAFLSRVQMKAIDRRNNGKFLSWTTLDDDSKDEFLFELALKIIPQDELVTFWTGHVTSVGTRLPLRPVVDTAERNLCELIRRVLSGMA